jgi:lipoprotein NlpD
MLAAMNGLCRLLAVATITSLLVACVPSRSVVVEPAPGNYSPGSHTYAPHAMPHPQAPGGSYQVVKGDTLYSIAFRHRVDVRDLASWNGIAAPYTIWPGQLLKFSPATPASANRPRAVATVTTAPRSSQPTPAAAPMFEAIPSASPAASASVPSSAHIAPPASRPAPSSSVAKASTAPTVVPVAGVPESTRPVTTPPAPPVAPSPASGGTRSISGIAWRWPAEGSLFKRFQSGDAIPGIEIAGHSGSVVRAAADGVVVYSGNGLVGYGELIIIKHNDSFLSAYGHNSKRLVKEGQRVSAGQQIAEMGSTGASRDELQFQIRRDGNPVDPLQYLPPR